MFGMGWYTLSGASNSKKKGGYGVKEIVGILSGCRNEYSECNTAVARNVISNVDTAITVSDTLPSSSLFLTYSIRSAKSYLD